LLEAVEAALEVADLGGTIREAAGLFHVGILFDGGIQEGCVDVELK
jgi:hypothetical protein